MHACVYAQAARSEGELSRPARVTHRRTHHPTHSHHFPLPTHVRQHATKPAQCPHCHHRHALLGLAVGATASWRYSNSAFMSRVRAGGRGGRKGGRKRGGGRGGGGTLLRHCDRVGAPPVAASCPHLFACLARERGSLPTQCLLALLPHRRVRLETPADTRTALLLLMSLPIMMCIVPQECTCHLTHQHSCPHICPPPLTFPCLPAPAFPPTPFPSTVPVVASIIYGTPENMQSIVNKFRFVEYPAEDTRGGDVLVGQSISREERAKAVATAAAGREAGKEGGRPQEEKKGGWGGLWRK